MHWGVLTADAFHSDRMGFRMRCESARLGVQGVAAAEPRCVTLPGRGLMLAERSGRSVKLPTGGGESSRGNHRLGERSKLRGGTEFISGKQNHRPMACDPCQLWAS